MYQLKYDLIGKSSGDFRPQYNEPEQSFFIESLEYQLNKRGIRKVFSPHCKLTTNVARLGDENQKSVRPWLIRTEPGFDGGMITEPDTALALFNADCPVVILFDKWRGCLVLLHAGFRCLVPKDSTIPSIVQTAFRDLRLKPLLFDAFIGFGAGPCCYGANHINEIYRPELAPFIERATKGPRVGQFSLNLAALAKEQLIDCGILENNISVDNTCTACASRENGGNGQYHSNIYEGVSAGRNLVLAWFHHSRQEAR